MANVGDELQSPEDEEAAARAAARAEADRRVGDSLSEAGLDCNPYTRLAVAVELTELRAEGPIRLDLRQVHKDLAAALALPVSTVRSALRVIRHCGCLLSADGTPQLSWNGVATDLVSDEPLVLDEICIRFATRAVLRDVVELLDDENAVAAFVRRVGSRPYAEGTARSTALSVLSSQVGESVRSVPLIVELIRTLRTKGMGPQTARRDEILTRVEELVDDVPLTADQLAQELGAQEVIAVLSAAKVLRGTEGSPIDGPDTIVSGFDAPNGLESAFRAEVRTQLSEFHDEPEFEQALERLLDQPPPLSAHAVRDALAQEGLRPYPKVRHQVLREILRSLKEPTPRQEVIDTVTEAVPTGPGPVAHIIDTLVEVDAISQHGQTLHIDGQPRVVDLDELLVERYIEVVQAEHPAARDAGGRARVRRFLGARGESR
jgi:hypothetical protein